MTRRIISAGVFAVLLSAASVACSQTPSDPPATPPDAVVVHPGGDVKPPVMLHAPTPEYSEEARERRVNGTVLVYLEVDTNGNPMHVRVLRGVGWGLDEEAIQAVRKYRFKPATRNGVPVAVAMNVVVNFAIKDHP